MATGRTRIGRLRYGLIGFFLIIGLLIPAWLYFRNGQSVEAKAAYKLAVEQRAKKDLISARNQLRIAVKANPKWVAANLELASVALELLDGETALMAVQGARAAGLDTNELHHLRGHALWLRGDLDGAETALNSEIVRDDHRIYALRILARVYTDRGNITAATATLAQAQSAAPDDSMVWTEMARMRLADGNQKSAIEAADKALFLDPENVRGLEIRGRLARTHSGFLSSLPYFERALKVNPNDIPTLSEYAATLGDVGRASDMLKPIRKIITINKRFARAYYMQAVIAARAGEYALAKRILDRSGDAAKEVPGAIMLAGICEYQLGNYNYAANIFQRLVDLQPLNVQARRLLARAMFRSGDSFGTLDVIAKSVGRPDADSYSLHLAARSFEAIGERGQVAKLLARAQNPVIRDSAALPEPLSFLTTQDEAKRNPNDARRLIPYIRNLVKSGDFGSAQSLANQLQAKNPNVADSHILVGDVANLQGQRGVALTAYSKARAISFTEPLLLKLVDTYRRNGNEAAARSTIADFFAQNPNSLPALRLSAYVDLDTGKWRDAIPKMEQLVTRLGYNDVVLDANLARAYSAIGRHDKATELAAIAYRIEPANSMVTYTYGGVLFKSGKRPKAALDLLKKASILLPDNEEVQKTYAATKSLVEPKPAPKKPLLKKPVAKK